MILTTAAAPTGKMAVALAVKDGMIPARRERIATPAKKARKRSSMKVRMAPLPRKSDLSLNRFALTA
jgi:hypothetical protein